MSLRLNFSALILAFLATWRFNCIFRIIRRWTVTGCLLPHIRQNKRRRRFVRVTRDADAGSVARRVSAFEVGAAPAEPGAGKVEIAKRRAILGEREKSSAHVVQIAGQSCGKGVDSAARPALERLGGNMAGIPSKPLLCR